MLNQIKNENARFATSLPVVIFTRPAVEPLTWDREGWREYDRGPGIFTFPADVVVNVRARNIGDDELQTLASEIATCPAIVELDLSENRKISDDSLQFLVVLKHLRSLNLSSCSLTSTGMVTLALLTHLERLNLSYCNRINDDGLKRLKSLVNLEYLDLQGCVKISHGGIARLSHAGLTIHE
jgi:Leucine-rich repeat (LRR) protein